MTCNSNFQGKRRRKKRMMRLFSGKFEIFLQTLVAFLWFYQVYLVQGSTFNSFPSSQTVRQPNPVKLPLEHQRPARIVQLIGGKVLLECPISPLVLTRTIRQPEARPRPFARPRGSPTGQRAKRAASSSNRSDILKFVAKQNSSSAAAASGNSNVIDEAPTRGGGAAAADAAGRDHDSPEVAGYLWDQRKKWRAKRKIAAQGDDSDGQVVGGGGGNNNNNGDDADFSSAYLADDSIELILWYHTPRASDQSKSKSAASPQTGDQVTRPIYIVDARRPSGRQQQQPAPPPPPLAHGGAGGSRYGGGANNSAAESLVQVRGPSEDSIKANAEASIGGNGGSNGAAAAASETEQDDDDVDFDDDDDDLARQLDYDVGASGSGSPSQSSRPLAGGSPLANNRSDINDRDSEQDEIMRRRQRLSSRQQEEFQLASVMGAMIAANSARHYAAAGIKSRVKFGLRRKMTTSRVVANWSADLRTGRLPVAYLIIDKLEPSDAGQYKCRVDFRFARTRYQVSQLDVITPVGELDVKMVGGERRQVELAAQMVAGQEEGRRPTVSLMGEPAEVNEDEQLEFECAASRKENDDDHHDVWPKAQVAWWRIDWLVGAPTSLSAANSNLAAATSSQDKLQFNFQLTRLSLESAANVERVKVTDSPSARDQLHLNQLRLARHQMQLNSINTSSVAAIITSRAAATGSGATEAKMTRNHERHVDEDSGPPSRRTDQDSAVAAAAAARPSANNSESNYDDNYGDNDSSWMTSRLRLAMANFMRNGLGSGGGAGSGVASGDGGDSAPSLASESEMSKWQPERKLIAHIVRDLDLALRFGDQPESLITLAGQQQQQHHQQQQQQVARFLAQNQFVLYVCGASNTHNSALGNNLLPPPVPITSGAKKNAKDTNQLGGASSGGASARLGDKLAKIQPTFSSILVKPNVVPKYVRIFLVNRKRAKPKEEGQQQIELTPLKSGQFVHLNLAPGSSASKLAPGRTTSNSATGGETIDHVVDDGGRQLQFVCLVIGTPPPESSVAWTLNRESSSEISDHDSGSHVAAENGNNNNSGQFIGSSLKLVRDNQTETDGLIASVLRSTSGALLDHLLPASELREELGEEEAQLLRFKYQLGSRYFSSVRLHNINIWDHETALSCSASNERYNQRAAIVGHQPPHKIVETSVGLNISHVPFVNLMWLNGKAASGGQLGANGLTSEINVAFGRNISLACGVLFANPPPSGQLEWLINGQPLGSLSSSGGGGGGDWPLARQVEVLERRPASSSSYANINNDQRGQRQRQLRYRQAEELIFRLNYESRLESTASSSSSSSLNGGENGAASDDINLNGSEKFGPQVGGGEVLPLKCKVTNALGFGISNEFNLVAGHSPYCLNDNPLTSTAKDWRTANMSAGKPSAANGDDKAANVNPWDSYSLAISNTINGLDGLQSSTADKTNSNNNNNNNDDDDLSFFCPVISDKHSSSYYWLLAPANYVTTSSSSSGDNGNVKSGRRKVAGQPNATALLSLTTTDLPVISVARLISVGGNNNNTRIAKDGFGGSMKASRLFCYAADKFGSNDMTLCAVRVITSNQRIAINKANDEDSQHSTGATRSDEEFEGVRLAYECMANLVRKSLVLGKLLHNQDNVFTSRGSDNRSSSAAATLAPSVQTLDDTNRLLLAIDCQESDKMDQLSGVNKSADRILVNFDLYRLGAAADDDDDQRGQFVKRLTSQSLEELATLSLVLDIAYNELDMNASANELEPIADRKAINNQVRSTGTKLGELTMGEAVNMHNIVISFTDSTHRSRHPNVSLPLNSKRINLGAPSASMVKAAQAKGHKLASSSLSINGNRQINDRFSRTSGDTTGQLGPQARGWVFLVGNIVLVLLGSLTVLTFVWVCKANSSTSDINEIRRKALAKNSNAGDGDTATCLASDNNNNNFNSSSSSSDNNGGACPPRSLASPAESFNQPTVNMNQITGLYLVGETQGQLNRHQQQQQPVAYSTLGRYHQQTGLQFTPLHSLSEGQQHLANCQMQQTTNNADLSNASPFDFLIIDSTSPNSNDSGIGQQQQQQQQQPSQQANILTIVDRQQVYQDQRQQQQVAEGGWLNLVSLHQQNYNEQQHQDLADQFGFSVSRNLCDSVSSNHDTDQGIQLMISGSDSSSPNRFNEQPLGQHHFIGCTQQQVGSSASILGPGANLATCFQHVDPNIELNTLGDFLATDDCEDNNNNNSNSRLGHVLHIGGQSNCPSCESSSVRVNELGMQGYSATLACVSPAQLSSTSSSVTTANSNVDYQKLRTLRRKATHQQQPPPPAEMSSRVRFLR